MTSRSIRIAILTAFLLAACRHEESAVTDDLGRAVVLPQRIDRVITLAPNVTEIVAAIGAHEKIIATDDFSNYPAGMETLPKVGGLEPNLERVAQLQPDLVIASTSGNPASLAPALANLGIPLYVIKTDRLDDVPRVMLRLGEILRSSRAEAAQRELVRRLMRGRRRRSPKPRVLFLVWTDPLYVAAHNTFISDLFEYAGAETAVARTVTGWPQYSMEALIAHPPDIMIYPKHAVGADRLELLFTADERWRSLQAVQSQRVFGVEDDRFSRPGPRVADALTDLNQLLDSVSF